jgi:hypothetical protein
VVTTVPRRSQRQILQGNMEPAVGLEPTTC